jgi:ligand-binding SRPBCC domain-containing protein
MINLRIQTLILAPQERCFDLARSVDAHNTSAALIHGKAIAGRMSGLSVLGDWTTWSARFFGMRFSLTTAITAFNSPSGFSDTLQAGLLTDFGHIYLFEATGIGQTLMTDDFFFQSPFGFLGSLFDRFLLRPQMQKTMDFRALTLKRIAESEANRA